jgi:hypothetical protein
VRGQLITARPNGPSIARPVAILAALLVTIGVLIGFLIVERGWGTVGIVLLCLVLVLGFLFVLAEGPILLLDWVERATKKARATARDAPARNPDEEGRRRPRTRPPPG